MLAYVRLLNFYLRTNFSFWLLAISKLFWLYFTNLNHAQFFVSFWILLRAFLIIIDSCWSTHRIMYEFCEAGPSRQWLLNFLFLLLLRIFEDRNTAWMPLNFNRFINNYGNRSHTNLDININHAFFTLGDRTRILSLESFQFHCLLLIKSLIFLLNLLFNISQLTIKYFSILLWKFQYDLLLLIMFLLRSFFLHLIGIQRLQYSHLNAVLCIEY